MIKYLITYGVNDRQNATFEANNLKELILKFAEYDGLTSDTFHKAIEGFDNNDIIGMVDLFRQFTWTSIENIYEIKDNVYSLYGKGI